MRYLRTKLGTDHNDADFLIEDFAGKLKSRLNANPDYDLSLVREWLIEFDVDNYPGREIGLTSNGTPVLAGPDDRNYGFWLDTNMRFDDFVGNAISSIEFNEKWDSWTAMRKSD